MIVLFFMVGFVVGRAFLPQPTQAGFAGVRRFDRGDTLLLWLGFGSEETARGESRLKRGKHNLGG